MSDEAQELIYTISITARGDADRLIANQLRTLGKLCALNFTNWRVFTMLPGNDGSYREAIADGKGDVRIEEKTSPILMLKQQSGMSAPPPEADYGVWFGSGAAEKLIQQGVYPETVEELIALIDARIEARGGR